VTVHGIYSGRLDNAGERLALSYSGGGAVVFSVTYGDRAPWPVASDGWGFSLVPVDALADLDPDQARYWRASHSPGGSPGADDPPPGLVAVRSNEVRTHPNVPDLDAIELLNPSDTTVLIGGWFLTDDPSAPKKFRVPDGLQLAAGGYKLFTEDQFNGGSVVPGGN